MGALLVLHTWGQQLQHHPHIHAVVPGGGLSPDGTKWVSSRAKFFVSVKVLGRLFRGKFLAGLRALYNAGELRFGGSTEALRQQPVFQSWLRTLYRKEWNVYAKKPFAGPDVLLKYLTRYTHRVALSNSRLLKLEGDKVTLRYKDYADDYRIKEMTLTGVELVRRFALHILPKGFVRVRQCGILAHRGRRERLALCRRLLGVPTSLPPAGPIPPMPLPSAPDSLTDRMKSAPVELPTPENASPSATTPNALPALSLPAVLLLTLALSWDALGWLLACASSFPVVRRCPSCGLGELQTIWEQPRPPGRQRKTKAPWNTS